MKAVIDFLKNLFGTAEQEVHEFCGHCGGKMLTIENVSIWGYSRVDGRPFQNVTSHRECENKSNPTNGSMPHDYVA